MKRPRFVKCMECGKRREVKPRGSLPMRCEACVRVENARAVARWRSQNRDAYNGYAREYQRSLRAKF